VLAPLAVGGHVDHRIVREAGLLLGRQGWPVPLYEDVPYVMREGAVDQALAEIAGDLGSAVAALRRARPDVVVVWREGQALSRRAGRSGFPASGGREDPGLVDA
jgi:hypothetical protein